MPNSMHGVRGHNAAVNEPKRARGSKGKYKADDPDTPDKNEAYVAGQTPAKKKAKKAAKKSSKKKAAKKSRK